MRLTDPTKGERERKRKRLENRHRRASGIREDRSQEYANKRAKRAKLPGVVERRRGIEIRNALAIIARAARLSRKSIDRQEECQEKPWLAMTDRAEAWATRYRLDPEFNLKIRIRNAMRRRRRGHRIGDVLRAAMLRGGHTKLEAWLGYTAAELRAHLERQFTRGMTWDRFAAGEIHIDHILPLASFRVEEEGELRAAWALPNLRPLWAGDNRKKHANRILLI